MLEKPAERPLRAFISSVMSPDAKPARDAVIRAFNRGAVLESWAFEYTPASNVVLAQSYLKHVRDCDLFVYLATRTTTAPVVAEVREAIRLKRPILVFRFADDDGDALSAELLEELRLLVKWQRVASVGALEEAVGRAVDDYLVRAVRHYASRPVSVADRRQEAVAMLRASYGRIISGLQSLEVPYLDARVIATDPNIACDATPSFDRSPLQVLSGVIGAGKTLVAERHFQESAARWGEDQQARIPLFIRARDIPRNVQEHVRQHAASLGNPDEVGIALVVDGLDEPGEVSSALLIEQLRELTTAFPTSTCLVTTRPNLKGLANSDEVITLQKLSDAQSLSLIARISERSAAELPHLPDEVRDIVAYPLYAVIYGSLLRDKGAGAWYSSTELMHQLVARSVQRMREPSGAQESLRKLALTILRRGGRPVPLNECPGFDSIEDVRLVILQDQAVSFALPMFVEWFAADAIVRGEVSLDEVIAEPNPDSWFNTLAAVVRFGPLALVDNLCSLLVLERPSIAARVVSMAIGGHLRGGGPDLPPSDEASRRLRIAMDVWAKGLLPISGVWPILPDGSLGPMTITTAARSIEVHYHTEELVDGVFDPDTVYSSTYVQQLDTNVGWPWRFGLDAVRGRLKHALDRNAFSVGSDIHERLWYAYIMAVGLGSLHCEPIPVGEVLAAIGDAPDTAVIASRLSFSASDLRLNPTVGQLKHHLANKSLGGQWLPPHPGPDRIGTGNKIWSDYSDARIGERIASVYKLALAIYREICEQWFPKLRLRFSMFELMPLVVECTYLSPNEQSFMAPVGTLAYRPLPRKEQSSVCVRLVATQSVEPLAEIIRRRTEMFRLRPGHETWLSMSTMGGHIPVFDDTPARAIAHRWLKDDLRDGAWL